MTTLYEKLSLSVPPWRSLEAISAFKDDDPLLALPQQEIDVCLMCEHCADACDRCDGKGNLGQKRGRPAKEIDTAKLRDLLRLRVCNREMCAALGVGERTLQKYKTQFREETK